MLSPFLFLLLIYYFLPIFMLPFFLEFFRLFETIERVRAKKA